MIEAQSQLPDAKDESVHIHIHFICQPENGIFCVIQFS